MKNFSIIVAAVEHSQGIGYNGKLPWENIPKDLEHFRLVTTKTTDNNKQNAVIMGRKTWESLPDKYRPLPNRLNVILTRQNNIPDDLNNNTVYFSDFEKALSFLSDNNDIENIFVIGGEQIYNKAINHPNCERIYYTKICSKKIIITDTKFPSIDPTVWSQQSLVRFSQNNVDENKNDIVCKNNDNNYYGEFILYEKTNTKENNPEEQQYLDLVKQILYCGESRPDRTGTGTLSLFGKTMRFSLRDNRFPLLTTKKVYFKGVVEELLWFISGSTNSKTLSEKGVKIWDKNGSKEYLDSLGLTNREEGDLGPIYSFQWRHCGAKYIDMHTNYTNQGIDQLAQIINTLKTNPFDRRMIMCSWNVSDLKLMALPPCHVMCQFYVNNEQELSCQMYQRSGDMGLGVPFNIASYSLLTIMIAHVCGLKCGEFNLVLGDAHIYKNHVIPLQTQLERTPKSFPRLYIKNKKNCIDDFVFEDFKIDGYNPDKKIEMDMSI